MTNRYEELEKTRSVQLGGVNKTTGKKNPTELEGYYVGVEKLPNKFNPGQPKNFYKFLTAAGEVGIFASAGLDYVLKGATPGLMTKVVSTGETLDTGKGNPMKVFKAYQDKTNSVGDTVAASTESLSSGEDTGSEDEESDVAAPTRATPPAKALSSTDAERQAKFNALRNKSKAA